VSLRSLSEKFKGRIVLLGILLLLSTVPGEYYIRWIASVALAAALALILVGYDVRIPYRKEASEEFKRPLKPEFERALTIVERSKKGGSRKLVEEDLLEILYILYDGKFNYQELRSNPPPALKAFYSSPNPYEGLKEALKILEAELNEDRGSSREV